MGDAGFFDDIIKKRPDDKAQAQKEEDKKPLDLTKKISLNFEKLDLHKEEVRKKRLFALDVSGSMDDKIGEKRKINHLRDVMAKYPDAKILCFSSNIKKASGTQSIPDPGGSTNLAGAFKYINENMMKIEPPERIVLVSDGEPDDERGALERAKNLSLPIDIIFIGEKDSKGHKFMHQLATATGGQEFQVT